MNDDPHITPWLAYRMPRKNALVRLFCFPFAGGGASFYRTWANDLSSDIEVCPVQYPGRETRIREKPFQDLQPLVESAAVALMPLLDRPFCFFGHSMGALVAFELARLLGRSYGRSPIHLIASGYHAPHLAHQSSLRHDLPDEQMIKELGSLNGTPKEALESPDLMAFLLPLLRADCRVCDEYQHRPDTPIACPITVYGGSDDIDAKPDMLSAWHRFTQSDFNVRLFPGGHFYLQTGREDFFDALTSDLHEILARRL